MTDLPLITLAHGRERRIQSGHPWVFSNELTSDPALQSLPPGGLVRVVASGGQALGTATYNPKTLIAARLLTRDAEEAIDTGFFHRRLAKALALRERLYDAPYYRLIHAEADGLPGTIVDRYGDVLVVQSNTAGGAALAEMLYEALEQLCQPRAIVARNDSASRGVEGLETSNEVVRGSLDGAAMVIENGVKFEVELLGGQKTGWFYDQRDNRAFVAKLAAGQGRVLDVYAYAGGFGIGCALAGAGQVLAVDRSESALELVTKGAASNGVSDRVSTRRGEAFGVLEDLAKAGERFDVVIADPPAFIKTKKDMNPGMRAYAKLARLAAALVNPGGILFIASCSYHAATPEFTAAVAKGLGEAKRTGRILRTSGAGADHPVHPAIPETAYLKALTLQIN
jgi:23S rRNA (cytosine1962-C5)-methyltransferase